MTNLLNRKKPSPPQSSDRCRLLIVKTSSLGDIIHSFPVVNYLRSRFPNATIDWMVEESFSDLLRAHPLINNVISVNTKKWRRSIWKFETLKEIRKVKKNLNKDKYDVIFDLQGNLKSGLISHLAKGKDRVGFGRSSVAESLNLFFNSIHFDPPIGNNIRSDYLSLVQQYFQDKTSFREMPLSLKISEAQKETVQLIADELKNEEKLAFMICPGSFWPNKQLSYESLLQLIKQLTMTYPANLLLIWGNDQEKAFADNLHAFFPQTCIVAPKLSIPVLQHLMQRMDAILAMDSLPLHLAGTTMTPTFSFFGPSSAEKYAPLNKKNHAYQGKCPYGQEFIKRCSLLRTCPTGACLKNAKGDLLFEEFKKWWMSIKA